MSSRTVWLYKDYVRLLERWPVDRTKDGRDLGQFLRLRMNQMFGAQSADAAAEPGDVQIRSTQFEADRSHRVCVERLRCLGRIVDDHHRLRAARACKHGFLPGDDAYTLKVQTSTEVTVMRNRLNASLSLIDSIRRGFGYFPTTEAQDIEALPVYTYAKRIGHASTPPLHPVTPAKPDVTPNHSPTTPHQRSKT